jgi:hypothetical protein
MKKMEEKTLEDGQRVAEQVNTTPTKKILYTSVIPCGPLNAVTELQDNLVDYVSELVNEKGLKEFIVKSEFKIDKEGIEIRWNKGIPKDRRMALLTPGLKEIHDSRESIGTWSMGAKIALHTLGRGIDIETHVPGEDTAVIYEYDDDWLTRSDGTFNEEKQREWGVEKIYKRPSDDDYTLIRIRHPSIKVMGLFSGSEENLVFATKEMVGRLSHIYGMTFSNWINRGIEFDMRINGMKVEPKPCYSDSLMVNDLSRLPGFEPTEHVYTHGELIIHVIVGCTNTSDKDTFGMYFYGNHGRLFGQRERNIDFLGGIDINHPQKKSWQMHIFFEGPPESIPWNSPMKDGVNYNSHLMATFKGVVRKILDPYLAVGEYVPQGIKIPFSQAYYELELEQKKHRLCSELMKADIKHGLAGEEYALKANEIWEDLPPFVKNGMPYSQGIVESRNHGELVDAINSRMHEETPKWTKTKASKWFKKHNIRYKVPDIETAINWFWAFADWVHGAPPRPAKGSRVTEILGSAEGVAPMAPSTVSETEESGEETSTVISGRIPGNTRRRLAIMAGSDSNTDILNYTIDVTLAAGELMRSHGLPPEVKEEDQLVVSLKKFKEFLDSKEYEKDK